jgi:hypothetical protein
MYYFNLYASVLRANFSRHDPKSLFQFAIFNLVPEIELQSVSPPRISRIDSVDIVEPFLIPQAQFHLCRGLTDRQRPVRNRYGKGIQFPFLAAKSFVCEISETVLRPYQDR